MRVFFSRLVLGASCVLLFAVSAGMAQQVPRPSPDFQIQFPDGKAQTLSQYRGKVVALEFLFTT
jgi:hypothetical protein